MKTSESFKLVAAALVKAQRKMGAASKDAKNPYFKSNYADLGSVMEVVKGPLNDEGISILQPASTKDGAHYVETILLHESGEYISSDTLKLELNKTDMQSLGSAITYARRYTLQSLLSVPSADDDGEATMDRKPTKVSKPELVEKNNTVTLPIGQTSESLTITSTPILADGTAKPANSFTSFRGRKPLDTSIKI